MPKQKPIKFVDCTWGYGPDILLGINNECIDSLGYIDLTVNEAKQLVIDLEVAIRNVDNLNQTTADYFDEKEKQEKHEKENRICEQ